MIIHATNVTGLGALVLSRKLILKLRSSINKIYASSELHEKIGDDGNDLNITEYNLSYFSRLYELLFKKVNYGDDVSVVLGDIPLKITSRQILYLHNPHLIRKVTIRNFQTLKNYVNRQILILNIKYVDVIVVQTHHTKANLLNFISQNCKSSFMGTIKVAELDVPKGLKKRRQINSPQFKLFYPARKYDHKNHQLIFLAADAIFSKYPSCELILTVNEDPTIDRRITVLGEISEIEVNRILDNDDVVLLFPSLTETLGLPLIEALQEDIPILAADLDYARELCGDAAIYFDPHKVNSLLSAISELKISQKITRTKKVIDIYGHTADQIKKASYESEL